MHRSLAAPICLCLCLAAPAVGQRQVRPPAQAPRVPVTATPAPPADSWHARGRALFERVVNIPTVQGRGQMDELVALLSAELRAGGFDDIQVHPHGETQSMVIRWRAAQSGPGRRTPSRPPRPRKGILLMAHMDVVEALAVDWSRDPFVFAEEGGYFYGRGTTDNKAGVVSIVNALLRLRAEGFRPTRDITVLFTGDEETGQEGAELAVGQWIDLAQIDYALNSDAGNGGFRPDGQLLGFEIQTAEKTYQSFTFTDTNPGGHSSRPRPDNAIYNVARALGALAAHRFEPRLNDTTRASLAAAAVEAPAQVQAAIRAWLANPADGAAADVVEGWERTVGQTRTRCVATQITGGHAENALPQLARATVNCRIFPGEDPASVLTTLRGLAEPAGVAVEPIRPARPSDASPLREDVVAAYTAAVRARHPGATIVPGMSTGATDGLYTRNRGIPTYGVGGGWVVVPEDLRAHGRDERVPVRAFYDSLDHWADLIRRTAG